MIKLIIDNQECDMHSSSTIVLNYDSDSLVDIDAMSEGESVTIAIPSTANNDSIMEYDGEFHTPQRFNSTEHSAQVWCSGQMLFSGDAVLYGVKYESGRMWYTIQVSVNKALWAQDASENVFNEFGVELDMKLDIDTIENQWESDDPVRFVVVWRDTYTPVQSSVSTEMVREIAALEDYHPFLHVGTMLNSIFEGSGYRVVSNFLESEQAQSLYMSGSYGSSTNSTETRNAMDFYVRRYEDASSTANIMGRVYLTPSYVANSIGAVVDAETATTESDCYSYGGCFTEVNGVPTFTPLVQVYVGFAVRLRYITPYKIESRKSLQAFDSVYLCSGHNYQFNVANNFEDKREEAISSTFSYMVCIFDYDDEQLYIYCRLADGTLSLISAVSSRVTYFTSPSQEVSEVVLLDSDGEPYAQDWALYNGYVEETGSTEVDVTLRITPELVSASSSVKFNEMFIYGAEQGWEFTLKAETCITPYFAKHPGCNTYIAFADIAQIDSFQSSLVESIAHMYNLRMFTDESNKVVYIEPYDDFWDSSSTWDWSDKIDKSYDISMTELATEVYRERKWGYRDGDGVTTRGDGDIPADDEFGFWSAQIASYASKEGSESLLSPLYSPSQSTDEGILQVGDRDDVDNINTFDFTPRIVRYKGDIEYNGEMMPRMAFYNPDDGVSLCFEDRGGVTGLNSYYARQIAVEERGVIISLKLRLSPFDIASLFSLSEVAPSVLSYFSFTINGEKIKCLLKEIVEYNPLDDSTLCRFIVVD